MRLEDCQNSVNIRAITDEAIIDAFSAASKAIGCMMAEGRSLRFNGIEALEKALKHIEEAEKELAEMRALDDSRGK